MWFSIKRLFHKWENLFLQMEKRKNRSSMDIQKVLLGMREYRMGLIQTPDQLRFSYMAVIEGAKLILTDNSETQVVTRMIESL